LIIVLPIITVALTPKPWIKRANNKMDMVVEKNASRLPNVNTNNPMSIKNFRPYFSDKGPNANIPVALPNKNKVMVYLANVDVV
jgi:hypothetical protein